jgi:cytochrome c biogenesis protein CcmG/thiol:disulfide interchange protein DsbE
MNSSISPKRFWQIGIVILVAVLLWFLWKGLSMGGQSMIVVDNQQGRAFPNFSLAKVDNQDELVTLKDIKGKVQLVHIFASWCGVCMDEHATWMTINKKWPYPIIGVVYLDEVEAVKAILAKKGDPYAVILNDAKGKLGLDLGLVGIPETYVLDNKGNIRMHQLGAMSLQQFESELLPMLTELSKEA